MKALDRGSGGPVIVVDAASNEFAFAVARRYARGVVMSFLLRRLGLGLTLAFSAWQSACSSSASDAPSTHGPEPPGDMATVRFDDADTLELGLGVPVSLHVIASPPKAYSVGFTLVGASLDASLDASVVRTNDAGRASVTLRAPSQATTFRVRAALLDASGVPGASAERAIAVSNAGFGTVRISPQYLGQRAVTTWTANVVAKSTCKDLAATLPADPPGALTGAAKSGGEPVIAHVPVGADLAVTLRAGHFAWGCAAAPSLTANATVDVPVMVIDKPLDLSAANLAATFTYSVDPISYASFLADAVGALDDAFMPTGTPEGTILLNAMGANAADPATFEQQRNEAGLGRPGPAAPRRAGPGPPGHVRRVGDRGGRAPAHRVPGEHRRGRSSRARRWSPSPSSARSTRPPPAPSARRTARGARSPAIRSS